MQTATRPARTLRSAAAVKTEKASRSTRPAVPAANEPVPLLVYVPRRARERLNKLVRENQLANQAEAITKLINDAYKKS